MFIPSEKLFARMNVEQAGLWFIIADNEDEVSIVLKLPTNIIKALYRGASSELIISVVEIEQTKVRLTAFKVYDIPGQPVSVSYPSHDLLEHSFIERMLGQNQVLMHFFDERTRPVLSSTGYFDQRQAKDALSDLVRTKPHYTSGLGKIIKLAHDFFQEDQVNIYEGKPSRALVNHVIPLSITDKQLQLIYEVGTGKSKPKKYSLDATDEGEGPALERLIYLSLEYIYSTNTFKSPQVPKSKSSPKLRELTDLLGFDSDTICLIESKVLPIFNTEEGRLPDRVKVSIEKNIGKGLGQLKGAIKNVREGVDIFDEKGQKINIQNRMSSTIHAIVLVSEMLVNGEKIAKQIAEISSQEQKVFYHVIDLKQLHRFILYSQESASRFHDLLLDRWNVVKNINDTNVVFSFSLYE